jgi:hypothetical protein
MMSKKLEDFIAQNKEAFNDYKPSPKLWDSLQKELNNKQVVTMQQATVKKLAIYKWVAAASVTLLIGLSIMVFTKKETVLPVTEIVKTVTPEIENVAIQKDSIASTKVPIQKEAPLLAKTIFKVEKKTELKEVIVDNAMKEEMVAFRSTQKHFANLISYKEKEIRNLAKNNPEIYKNFSADMEGLNKSYKQLTKQLPNTHNKSALINAMIYNLQIQIDLLNKQLIILNKIESSQKKERYEKDILSI